MAYIIDTLRNRHFKLLTLYVSFVDINVSLEAGYSLFCMLLQYTCFFFFIIVLLF